MQTALRLLDKEAMDKQRALDAALGQIERAFGKGSIMKLGSREATADTEVISTGSLSLDIALGIGGLPRSGAAVPALLLTPSTRSTRCMPASSASMSTTC